MKAQVGNNIKLGIFVTLGTVFLIVAIYFVGKKQNLFDTTFGLRAVFKDVSGLQPGNNIRFGGINVGIIEGITIVNDTSIRVDMQIQEDVRKFIKADSKCIIGSDGLMGNKILIITPGSGGNPVKNNAYLATTIPVNMDDIMNNLKVTVQNAAVLTDDLSQITSSIRSGRGTIGKLFMDSVFAEDIDKTVTNIKKGAGGFQENMEAAKSNILLRGYFRKKEKAKEEELEKKETAKEDTTKNTKKRRK
ncbi:MAG TPA: MlaD family protein [Bacteroidales bacterium]|nr:MlaD family protein [Bacteroidales bacterium]